MPEPSESPQTDVITETMLRDVLHALYQRVLADSLIGPSFARTLRGRWQVHIDHLIRVWLIPSAESGPPAAWPLLLHGSLGLTEAQFDRWLALVVLTINDRCPPTAAAILLDRFAAIGSSFRVGLGLDAVPRQCAGLQS